MMTAADGVVSLALVGLLSWVLKDLSKAVKGNTAVGEKVAKKIDSSHKTDIELLKFMQNLNGELKKAAEKKLQ